MACMTKAMPFIVMVLFQVTLAGKDILTKVVLNDRMSVYVLTVYRHGIATVVMAPLAFYFDRLRRPPMTKTFFVKISILGFLEYTTATFATAIYNMMPALAFVMAIFCRMETVRPWSIRNVGKVLGTVASVGGTTIMALIKGPPVNLFWTKHSRQNTAGTDVQSSLKGAVLVSAACLCYASFMILQGLTLRTYHAEISLTAWICLMGTIQGTIVALVMERGNPEAWALRFDMKLLNVTYSGIICSALGFYIGGIVMKQKGTLFVTAFMPLSMIMVAIMSSIIFAEQMYWGRVLGALVICVGLYVVLWGKAKDHQDHSARQMDGQPELPTTQATL